MSPGSPVTRDNIFFCSDDESDSGFYVQIEEGTKWHRHNCADPSWLYFLLTYVPPSVPDTTKKGEGAKRQPPPHKDQPWHFYCAQLHHYGLKPFKSKDAAKKHLLAAFGESTTLTVPPEVRKIRQDLQTLFGREGAKMQRKLLEEKKQKEQVDSLWRQQTTGTEDIIMGDATGSKIAKPKKRKAEDLSSEPEKVPKKRKAKVSFRGVDTDL